MHPQEFQPRLLCVPSCLLWFKLFYFINHKGHEGTQRKLSWPGAGVDARAYINNPADNWFSCYSALNSDISGQRVLAELRLENYAVIDSLAVEFAAGLNLLTGETGAGKSILIDALALLLGEKASSDVIRAGAQRAVVSAVFEVDDRAGDAIEKVLEQNGLDESEEGSLIIRREIAAGGKGRVFVNNQAATVAVLRQLAPHLATIHAQNESILLFDGPARLGLLDGFAGSELEPIAAAYEAWKGICT